MTYSVLKVLLNPNQPTNPGAWNHVLDEVQIPIGNEQFLGGRGGPLISLLWPLVTWTLKS